MGWWKPIFFPSFLVKIWLLFSSDFYPIHDAFLFALLREKKVLPNDYLLMEFLDFQSAFKKDSWWIVKPGEDSNRGNGIKVLNNL